MKTILVPVDFSTNSKKALQFADQLAKTMKANVLLMTVYTPIAGKYNLMHGVIEEEAMRAKKEANTMLKKWVTLYTSSLTTTIVQEGDTVSGILEVAKKKKANMIVMGTHGSSKLSNVVFGSNTAKIISKSEIPVLTIPLTYRLKHIEKLVYSSDFTNLKHELNAIIPFSQAMQIPIEVLFMDYGLDKTKNVEKMMDEVKKSTGFINLMFKHKKAVLEDSLANQIKAYTKKNNKVILVMFSQERSFFEKIFISSKTEELSYDIKVPLLSIKKGTLKTKK